MGNTASSTAEFHDAVDDAQAAADAAAAGPAGTKLYEYTRAASGASGWALLASRATPRFYDANGGSDGDDRSDDDEGGRRAPRDWHLEIDEAEIDARADEALQYVADKAGRRLTFGAGGRLFALRFPDDARYDAFMKQLESKVFVNTYGFDDDDAGRQKALGDMAGVFFSAQGGGAEAMEVAEDDGDDGPDPAELRERAGANKEGTPISAMLIGANANTFLQRGAQFDVLRNVEGGVEDSGITFEITPLGGRGAAGGRGASLTPTAAAAALTPGKAILAKGETAMHMLSPNDRQRLYHVNVERQKVVSEWAFAKDGVEVPQADIATDSKAAQLEDTNTFLGLDANRLCRWDMRERRGVVQESPAASALGYAGGKDYARGANFTCMATSGEGYVVVGSKDGRLRLYNSKTLTQAKTQIPGLGKPITAVDVTYDGAYVVATTDDYLLVVKTTFSDGATGRELCGFTDRAGARLATPRLLRLKPEDVVATGGKPFRHAKFTWVTEAGRSERWVVATCGRYSVVWNFKRVKRAVASATSFGGLPTCMDYALTKNTGEDVVDAGFLHERFTPAGHGIVGGSGGGRGRGAGGEGGAFAARDALVVATGHKVFSLANADGDDE